MNLFTGEAADEFFGGTIPETLRDTLHQAATAPAAERAALLWTAQSCAPQCLPVYYALYKHHAGRREFELAERAALRGLQEAASQAGLPESPGDVTPGMADFKATGPARFWLFTCKALAFIALRSGRPELSRARLAIIERVDPDSGVGNEVIAALLRASEEPGASAA
jgi:hypothetical protein